MFNCGALCSGELSTNAAGGREQDINSKMDLCQMLHLVKVIIKSRFSIGCCYKENGPSKLNVEQEIRVVVSEIKLRLWELHYKFILLIRSMALNFI